jgi:murein DD-endopeptidase MepM/ murein hydrolase activator NlpD
MPNGTKLYCPFPNGVVSFSGFTSDGYAYNLRIVDEVQGLMCVLAHMPKTNPFLVSVGQKVTFETPVGYSNNTGNSTGPHLHFEIRKKPWAYADCYRDILIDLDLLPTTPLPPPPPPPTNNPVLVKTTQPCKVYTSPSKTSPMLKRLSKAGISLMVTDVDGEWAKIVCGKIIDHGYIRWTMLDSQP